MFAQNNNRNDLLDFNDQRTPQRNQPNQYGGRP